MKKNIEYKKNEVPVFGIHNIGNKYATSKVVAYSDYFIEKRDNGKTIVFAEKGDQKTGYVRNRGYIGEKFFIQISEAKKAVRENIERKISKLKEVHEREISRLREIFKENME